MTLVFIRFAYYGLFSSSQMEVISEKRFGGHINKIEFLVNLVLFLHTDSTIGKLLVPPVKRSVVEVAISYDSNHKHLI